jgi:hypothetical protein
LSALADNVKDGFTVPANEPSSLPMNNPDQPMTREERLAAQLRENLKRRKAQARALAQSDEPPLSKQPPRR